MTIKEIFERINIEIPLSERKFLGFLNDTINELNTLYNNLATGIAQISKVNSLTDSFSINSLYHTAIVKNILFLAGAADYNKPEFLRLSEQAYKKICKDSTKGKIIKRNRW